MINFFFNEIANLNCITFADSSSCFFAGLNMQFDYNLFEAMSFGEH
jgi:hypothetical protein